MSESGQEGCRKVKDRGGVGKRKTKGAPERERKKGCQKEKDRVGVGKSRRREVAERAGLMARSRQSMTEATKGCVFVRADWNSMFSWFPVDSPFPPASCFTPHCFYF